VSTLPASTLEELESTAQDVRGLWGRRLVLGLLVLVLAAALVGLLGVRSTTAGDAAAGWTLDLEYASVARAGLNVPFTATVTHEDGFGEKVTLALTGTYLDIYETQGFHPEPDASTRDGETLYLTFETPPSGDTFVVTYDAYVQPAAQRGAHGTLSVLDEGRPVVSVDLHTRVWP
jgi:hypothetical protein